MDLVCVGVRVQAEQPDRARVRRPQADGALDRGDLTRSVRAQDAEDLTLGHRERHVVDRDQCSVGLAEMRDLNRRPKLCALAGRNLRLARLAVKPPERRDPSRSTHDCLLSAYHRSGRLLAPAISTVFALKN